MENATFDALVQGMVGSSSRRRVVRTGLGALVASALGALGMKEVGEAKSARKAHVTAEARRSRKGRKGRRQAPASAPAPAPQPAQFPDQTPCASGAQCASGTCGFNGRGQVCCSQAGQRCNGDFDCCGALLCDIFGTGTCF